MVSLRPAWATCVVPGQPGLHRKMFQKKKREEKRENNGSLPLWIMIFCWGGHCWFCSFRIHCFLIAEKFTWVLWAVGDSHTYFLRTTTSEGSHTVLSWTSAPCFLRIFLFAPHPRVYTAYKNFLRLHKICFSADTRRYLSTRAEATWLQAANPQTRVNRQGCSYLNSRAGFQEPAAFTF